MARRSPNRARRATAFTSDHGWLGATASATMRNLRDHVVLAAASKEGVSVVGRPSPRPRLAPGIASQRSYASFVGSSRERVGARGAWEHVRASCEANPRRR